MAGHLLLCHCHSVCLSGPARRLSQNSNQQKTVEHFTILDRIAGMCEVFRAMDILGTRADSLDNPDGRYCV